MKPGHDNVRAFLSERGCSKRVVDGGLGGLVLAWEKMAANLTKGYRDDLDEYLNDLDTRQILAEVLSAAEPEAVAPLAARLAAADEAVRKATSPFGKCVWGTGNATSHNWTVRRNWWYFRAPKLGNEQLTAELARVR